MIIPCKGCEYCNEKHDHGLFVPNKSKTFKKLQGGDSFQDWVCERGPGIECGFTQGYSEGSTYSGFFAEDEVRFAEEPEGDKDHLFVFGCANKETGEFFKQEADGILGIGARAKG